MTLCAPFPYFGGKSKIAPVVWDALGQPNLYIEPFFGSGAVFLARPYYDQKIHEEIIGDKDCFVTNVWRALKYEPENVAFWCDHPINQSDLIIRKKFLWDNKIEMAKNIMQNDEWCDPKMAGYWIWCACSSIGRIKFKSKEIPNLIKRGGIHKKSLATECYPNENIKIWFNHLQQRLRYVKVICDHWACICNKWLIKYTAEKTCGIFLDPPYAILNRSIDIYEEDSTILNKDIIIRIKKWGANKNYRIVLAGYDEYEELLNDDYGWTCQSWTGKAGYGRNRNRFREKLYFSPYCLKTELF